MERGAIPAVNAAALCGSAFHVVMVDGFFDRFECDRPAATKPPAPAIDSVPGGPTHVRGAFKVTYYVAMGYDAREIAAAEYADYVASGSCRPTSKLSLFDLGKPRPELQFVCEL
jgi:hypothetical protein